MLETSRRPQQEPKSRRLARKQQIQEALGEALAALQGMGIDEPTPHVWFPSARRRVFCLSTRPAGLKPRWRIARRFSTAPSHLSALIILLLLGVAMATRGFGVYTVTTHEKAEGGMPLLLRVRENSGPSESHGYGFAAAAMAAVQHRPFREDPPPPTEGALPSSPAEVPDRSEVVTYTVAAGDTLESIAGHFDVAPYTIFWVNHLHTREEIEPGRLLIIPPLSGVPHTVREGEDLRSIADMYGVRAGNIVGYPPNRLKYPYHLRPGQEIFVPGGVVEIPDGYVEDGERPPPTLVQMPGGEKLAWPTWGEITAPFGWSRAYGGYHHGVDIANTWGTAIYAAAAGTVTEAGWGALGWYVVIDHGNGFDTIYGHLGNRPLVSEGDEVSKGQQIGIMGRSYGAGGYASGVHLHFAVRHHGVLIDPLPLLEE